MRSWVQTSNPITEPPMWLNLFLVLYKHECAQLRYPSRLIWSCIGALANINQLRHVW